MIIGAFVPQIEDVRCDLMIYEGIHHQLPTMYVLFATTSDLEHSLTIFRW